MSEKKEDKNKFPKPEFFIFFIGLIFTLSIPLYFGLMHQPTEMGLSFAIGCVIMAFGNFDKLESFSGAGFKAKLRKKIEKAEVDIDTLKKLVVVLANPILSQMAWGNRWGGGNITNSLLMRNNIIKFMDEQNITDSDTTNLINSMNNLFAHDHIIKFREVVNTDILMETGVKEACKKEISNFDRAPGPLQSLTFNFDVINRILSNEPHSTDVDNAILDFEFFRENKEVRRPEIWKES